MDIVTSLFIVSFDFVEEQKMLLRSKSWAHEISILIEGKKLKVFSFARMDGSVKKSSTFQLVDQLVDENSITGRQLPFHLLHTINFLSAAHFSADWLLDRSFDY